MIQCQRYCKEKGQFSTKYNPVKTFVLEGKFNEEIIL